MLLRVECYCGSNATEGRMLLWFELPRVECYCGSNATKGRMLLRVECYRGSNATEGRMLPEAGVELLKVECTEDRMHIFAFEKSRTNLHF